MEERGRRTTEAKQAKEAHEDIDSKQECRNGNRKKQEQCRCAVSLSPGGVAMCLRTAGPVAQIKSTVLATLLIQAPLLAGGCVFVEAPGERTRTGNVGQGRAWHDKNGAERGGLNTGFVRVEGYGKKKRQCTGVGGKRGWMRDSKVLGRSTSLSRAKTGIVT